MSVTDVIKKSVLESEMYNQAVSLSTILTMVVDLLVALAMGLVIYEIYKKYYRGVVYSKNYAMTLTGVTVVTCMITLAISTNIVISLGMVGALSIVRFRTAIKEPLDLMYIFWAIATGIAAGASMYILIILCMIIMYIFIVGFSKYDKVNKEYIMIVHYNDNSENDYTGDEIVKTLDKNKHSVRSKVIRDGKVEMTIQVACRNNNLSVFEKVKGINNVEDVTMLSFDGEYHE